MCCRAVPIKVEMRKPRDILDPLSISLVHQHLLSSCPNLAQEFSAKYRPKMAEVGLEQVLGKWEEAQLTKKLVHQHLDFFAPSLVVEFSQKHGFPPYTRVALKEVVAKWKEDQMITGLVYQHLRTVTPDLALEFKDNHFCCYFEDVPVGFFRLLVEAQMKNHKSMSSEEYKLDQSKG